ncbi:MAG: peptidoglycan bridge formation glycyltransferase FemA/FemB family protein [Nitrososphaerota archaeon]
MSFRIIEISKNTQNLYSSYLSEWENFVYNSPLGNIFQSSNYAKLFSEKLLDWNLLILLKKGQIIGGMLSQVWPYVGLKCYRFSNFKTVYGPLFIESGKEVSFYLRYMLNRIEVKKPLRHLILTYQANMRELKNKGYYDAPHGIKGTFIIDLKKSENDLWKSLEKRCRYSIKHAHKMGVKALKINNDLSPYLYYNIHMETAKRLNIPPNPLSFYLNIWRIMTDEYADFFFAFFDNKPVAGIIIFKYKDKAYLYSSGLLKEYKNTYAMSLLIWNAILDLKRKGFRFLDMLFHPNKNDKKSPEYGLYLFKRSFGGKEIPVYHYEKIFSPKLDTISENASKLYKIIKFSVG